MRETEGRTEEIKVEVRGGAELFLLSLHHEG